MITNSSSHRMLPFFSANELVSNSPFHPPHLMCNYSTYYIALRLDAELFIPFFLQDPVGLLPLCTHGSQALRNEYILSIMQQLGLSSPFWRQKGINAAVFLYLLIVGSCLEHTWVSFPGNLLFLQTRVGHESCRAVFYNPWPLEFCSDLKICAFLQLSPRWLQKRSWNALFKV